MERAEPVVRTATAADAEMLAALAERTFRAAFTADNDPVEMERYIAAAFSVQQISAELDDERSTFFVCYIGDEVVGYAKLRERAAPPEVRGNAVELERIYVEPEGIGKGFGMVLMDACLNRARELGFGTVWLGVWETNEAAITFYQRQGFVAVGKHTFQFGREAQTDTVFERVL